MTYQRSQVGLLQRRLKEPRRFLQVVAGPRQVGKTTLVQQVMETFESGFLYASADEPSTRGSVWIQQQWDAARLAAKERGRSGAILALDEVQKITDWSETVKRLWDEDTRSKLPLKVIVLGSAPLLVARGLTESLAGRFETIHVPHWSFAEMREAFDFDLEQYLLFGGYPGAASLIGDPDRWRRYVVDSLIETSLSRDVLLLTRVDKPALLRQLFLLACTYSGQILSFTKMLGQLQDAGNTTTLAHYLSLLAGAGMVCGLQKFSGSTARTRGSIPKLQVMNTALMSASLGLTADGITEDSTLRGRLVESAVGAHLVNAMSEGTSEVFYWREGLNEVDFVVRDGRRITAIEVKSGNKTGRTGGMAVFAESFKTHRSLLVGAGGIPLQTFLEKPLSHWISP